MKKDSVNILCLYWVGDFRGRDFTGNDVVRLRESVDRHIDRPYTFYCLTNDVNAVIPAEKIPLIHDWPGWWSKIEIHRPDLPKGRTLYLDLDSHVIRNLGPILDYEGDLVMFRTRVPLRKQRLLAPELVHRYQAATMLFTPGSKAMEYVYYRFLRRPKAYMANYRSDQDVMGKWIPNQPVFPDKWMVKLASLRKQSLSEDVIIVTGRPGEDSFREPKFAPWLNEMARGGV